jgi:pimeloyl-ACP methyl ester carboxylesterase
MEFFLVHGGHHGEWVWEPLQKLLAEQGHQTRTVNLPTAVRDTAAAGPYPGLQDDAMVVRDALAEMDRPIVVAHSYGGVPVTEAITRANTSHVVYVAAYMLDVGESMLGRHGYPKPASTDGLRSPENPAKNLPAIFYDGDPDNPATAAAMSRLVPQSARADWEPVTRAGWREVPNSYVIPDNDLSTTAPLEQAMAERAQHVFHLPGNHAPFWSNPAEFAALLNRIAEAR